MNFDGFSKYIRKSGCGLKVYRRHTVKNISGYFDVNKNGRPYIAIATSGLLQSQRLELLAHEYGHYLQYLEDKNNPAEELDCYKIQDDWIAGKIELSIDEWKEARDLMLFYEWDADMRALKLAGELNLEPFNTFSVIRSAIAYNMSMKWSWDARKNFNTSVARYHFKPKLFTDEQVTAHLSKDEFDKLTKWIGA